MQEVKKLVIFSQIIIITIVNLNFCFTSSALFAYPDEKELYAQAIYLVNTDTDIVVYQKNAFAKQWPASTTKIMTAVVVLENITDLNAKTEISTSATDEFWTSNPNKTGVSNASLKIGQENLSYIDLLYGLMLPSACDAANVLAIETAGSIEAFAKLMNDKAAELGCVNTNFSNAHGLFEETNYSCAYDMYLISKYAMYGMAESRKALFNEIVNAEEHSFPPNSDNPDGYKKYNTNKLIIKPDRYTINDYYYQYANGVKTGSIDRIYRKDADGGWTDTSPGVCSLVSGASKFGYSYICVTMGAPYSEPDDEKNKFANYSFKDHIALYEWAFGDISYKTVLKSTEPVTSVGVVGGEVDTLQLIPKTDYSTLLPSDANLTAVQRIPVKFSETVEAPVKKGEVLGRVQLVLGGEILTEIDLVSAGEVGKSQTKKIEDQAKGYLERLTDSTMFKILVVVLILLIAALIVLRFIQSGKKSKIKNSAKRSRERFP